MYADQTEFLHEIKNHWSNFSEEKTKAEQNKVRTYQLHHHVLTIFQNKWIPNPAYDCETILLLEIRKNKTKIVKSV